VGKAVSAPSVDLAFNCKRFFLESTASPYPGHIGVCLWSPATSSYKYMERLEAGDCIIHFITVDSKSIYKKTFIGISRVARKAKLYTKEELIDKLKSLTYGISTMRNLLARGLRILVTVLSTSWSYLILLNSKEKYL
jgi:hypothetical protein